MVDRTLEYLRGSTSNDPKVRLTVYFMKESNLVLNSLGIMNSDWVSLLLAAFTVTLSWSYFTLCLSLTFSDLSFMMSSP